VAFDHSQTGDTTLSALQRTEGHFGLLLTGVDAPIQSFPRREGDKPLALILSKRQSNPPRYNVFGGGRRGELTGLQVLNREVREEAGPDVTFEVFGPLGNPLFGKIPVAAPTKADWAYPWLLLHTGGEPALETPETQDWARVTSSKSVAEKYGKADTDGKAAGAVRYYGDLPFVKGSTEGVLARTERMIWLALTLTTVPLVYKDLVTGDVVGKAGKGMPANLFGTDEQWPAPEERIYVGDEFLWVRTTRYAALWEHVDSKPLLDARSIEA
jgi:hypothetical protein